MPKMILSAQVFIHILVLSLVLVVTQLLTSIYSAINGESTDANMHSEPRTTRGVLLCRRMQCSRGEDSFTQLIPLEGQAELR